MGYGTNAQTVLDRMAVLQPLEALQTHQWVVKGGYKETAKEAYRIREGLYIAGLYPSRFPKLAAAAERMSIHVVARGIIEARLKPTSSVESAPAHLRQVTHGLEPFGREVPTVSMSTAQECIDSWIAHQPSNDPVRFVNTVLSPDELLKLYQWTRTHWPKLIILLGEHNKTLILSLPDPHIQEFAWSPAKPAEQPETFDL